MKILVIIAGYFHGNLCIDFSLFDMEGEVLVAEGMVEGIGCRESTLTVKRNGDILTRNTQVHNCGTGVILVIDYLMSEESAILKSPRDIAAVGHRITHGGERFKEHCTIDEKVLHDLRESISLAPLHNLYNIIPIEICIDLLPGVQQVAIFDTCFHQSLPDYAYIYGIPYEYYLNFGIRRYGFHGISHQYMAEETARLMGRPLKELRIITCHLGDGASVTATRGGKSLDTSMGFTPLEGLLMTTRCGDLDGAIVSYLMERNGLTRREIDTILNSKSGLAGISSISGNIFQLLDAINEGSYRAKLAVDVFCYRLKKYISAYAGVLGGIDAVAFSGETGENCPHVRHESLSGLEFMGMALDDDRNSHNEPDIGTPESGTRIFVLPSREKLMIARETYALIKDSF